MDLKPQKKTVYPDLSTFDLNSGSTNSPDNGNNVALFVISIWGQCSITVLLLWLVWCAVLKSPHRTHPDTQPCRHIRTTASIRFVNDVYSLSHTLSWFSFAWYGVTTTLLSNNHHTVNSQHTPLPMHISLQCGLFYKAKINAVTYCIALICNSQSAKFSLIGYAITKRWHSCSLGRTPTWWRSAMGLWCCISHTHLAPFNQGWTFSFSGVWFQNRHCEWRWAQLYLAGTALPPAPALVSSLPERWDFTWYTVYPTPSLSASGSNFRLRPGPVIHCWGCYGIAFVDGKEPGRNPRWQTWPDPANLPTATSPGSGLTSQMTQHNSWSKHWSSPAWTPSLCD